MKKYYLRFKFLILILLMPLLGCYVFNENARAFYGICDRYIMCMVSINVLTCILYMTNPCILKIFLSIIKPEKKLDNALIRPVRLKSDERRNIISHSALLL